MMGLDSTKPVFWVSDKGKTQTSLLSYSNRDLLENFNFPRSKFIYDTFQKANKKSAGLSVQMHKLVYPFVVCKPQRQVFSLLGPYQRHTTMKITKLGQNNFFVW